MESMRCERCGSTDVRRDQVWADEPLSLGECRRCALRWTQPLRRSPRRADERGGVAAVVASETIAA